MIWEEKNVFSTKYILFLLPNHIFKTSTCRIGVSPDGVSPYSKASCIFKHLMLIFKIDKTLALLKISTLLTWIKMNLLYWNHSPLDIPEHWTHYWNDSLTVVYNFTLIAYHARPLWLSAHLSSCRHWKW